MCLHDKKDLRNQNNADENGFKFSKTKLRASIFAPNVNHMMILVTCNI